MCDVEFTVSQGQLYLLQTRVGRRSPLAAVRIAVAMAEESSFPLTKTEALGRAGEDILREIAQLGRVSANAAPIASGLAVSPGVGAGLLSCDADRAAEWAAEGKAVVLARPETSPSDVHGMIASAALVTTLGGMVSHAAVVARGWAIPAVCSLVNATVEKVGLWTATDFVPEGETVTVDGTTGNLYRGDCREDAGLDLPEVRKLRAWALEGETSTGPFDEATGDVTPFELLRALQLKGLCSVERLAAALGCSEEVVSIALAPHESFLKTTPRGYALTAEGRDWVQQELQRESAEVTGDLAPAWARFQPLNLQLKVLVTETQMSAINAEHERWGWLLESMHSLHAEFRPVVDEVAGLAPRLRGYGRRFDAALAALAGGDQTMLASPLKDSYHTVWFEFHEEFIALTGRNREDEERAASH
jgi:pyruvate,orthophosphate dikinase